MISSGVLLVFSTIALVHSFPRGLKDNGDIMTIQVSGNENKSLNSQGSLQTLVMQFKKRNVKNESEIVEFVNIHNKNSEIKTKGRDHEKYHINQITNQQHILQKQNSSNSEVAKLNSPHDERNDMNKRNTEKLSDDLNNTGPGTTEEKLTSTETENIKWSLQGQEEASSLTGNWPRYLYDVFDSVAPFPEINLSKVNQHEITEIQSDKLPNFKPTLELKKNKPPLSAGPGLYPISVFSREFDIPFFD